ncbi:MAG: histidine phosphatase family protein [Actinomycetes bacterium]
MTRRLTLVTPALVPSARAGVLGGDDPLDQAGRELARRVSERVGPGTTSLVSAPQRRCRETASFLGSPAVEPGLRDWDMGDWTGRTLAEVAQEQPSAVERWRATGEAPHGGETLAQVLGRVAAWLDGLAVDGGRLVAVVPHAVARACVVRVLDCPAGSFWSIDVEPGALVSVSLTSAGMRLRWSGASGQG